MLLIVSCGDISGDYDVCMDVETARCERRAECKKRYPDDFKDFDKKMCIDYYEEICRSRDLASDVEDTEIDEHLDSCLEAIENYDCNELYPMSDKTYSETTHEDLLAVCPFLREEEKDDDNDDSSEEDDSSLEACDVFSQNCSDDANGCYPPSSDAEGSKGVCRPKGSKESGAECSRSSDCKPEYFCFEPEDADASRCYKVCNESTGNPGCPGEHTCKESGTGSLGYCEPNQSDAGV